MEIRYSRNAKNKLYFIMVTLREQCYVYYYAKVPLDCQLNCFFILFIVCVRYINYNCLFEIFQVDQLMNFIITKFTVI